MGRQKVPRPFGGRFAGVAIAMAILQAACSNGAPSGTSASAPYRAARNAAEASLLPRNVYQLPTVDFAGFQALGWQLHGTPVVINIWSSWCGPCRTEAPYLAAAAERYGEEIQFLGIDILDKKPDAIAFMQEYGWAYPSLYDPQGDIRDGLGFIGQPETLFYDREGELSSTWIGPLPSEELKERLQAISV
jgi:thiol-disulfide isomerase/thioredoxin